MINLIQLIILIAIILPRSNTFAESFHIVSDIDDTVKISHVESPLDAAYRFFFRKDYFKGMSTL
jgi:hypothetical protein